MELDFLSRCRMRKTRSDRVSLASGSISRKELESVEALCQFEPCVLDFELWMRVEIGPTNAIARFSVEC